MAHQASRLQTNPDGSTVHVFEGDEGLIYRACTGDQCVFCGDEKTAQAHLSYWRSHPMEKGQDLEEQNG